jgi:hypothetical protein
VAKLRLASIGNAKAVAYIYGAWCLFCLAIAFLNIGDGAVGAHLGLAFTGMPLSLVSLYMPHATLPAVAVAAILGWIQWVALVAWWSTDDPKSER